MLPSLLSIFLDYKCNFSCDHCSVGSSPKVSMPMPLDVLIKGIDEFSKLEHARVAGFTGGEVTLSKDKLILGIQHAKSKGLITRLVINGWWAKNKQKAKAFIEELKHAGLDEINTSYDQYHSPFMGLEPILNLVEEGLAQELTVALAVVGHEDAEFNADRIKKEIGKRLKCDVNELPNRLFVIEDRPAPVGSGENLDVSNMKKTGAQDFGCTEILKTLSLHPNGELKGCCGHTVFYSEDLILGNIKEESVPEITSRAGENIAYWLIHTIGAKNILEMLGVQGEYSHVCHACHVLLNEHRTKFIEYLQQNKQLLFRDSVLMGGSIKKIAQGYLSKSEIFQAEVVEKMKYSNR